MSWEILSPVIISVGVIAAVIAAIANVTVTLMNNHRLKAIEEKREMTEIDKYRYTRLYEIVMNWNGYAAPLESGGRPIEDPDEIISFRLINSLYDNLGRYHVIRPLLSSKYRDVEQEIEHIIEEGGTHLLQMSKAQDAQNIGEKQQYRKAYSDCAVQLEKLLREVINSQLEDLLISNRK
jgi:hypothetical protein